jgi:hypothetical protein
MSGYTYPEYIQAISAALESPITDPTSATPFVDPSYNNWLPRAIEAAEQRIYRELDLLGTRLLDNTGMLTPNNRRFTLPTDNGTFIVLEQVLVFTAGGVRNQLLPVSLEYLNAAWPTDVTPLSPSVPQVWAPFDQASIFVGPSGDTNYNVECIGTIRPNTLSSTNTSTIITQYLPDIFLYASLVNFAGYQRDYGQGADDPKLAQSWENQYQTGKQSAEVEQFRIRFQTQGWSSRIPSPVATPPQT